MDPGEGNVALNVGGGDPEAAEIIELVLDLPDWANGVSWSCGSGVLDRDGDPAGERAAASFGVAGGDGSDENGLGASS